MYNFNTILLWFSTMAVIVVATKPFRVGHGSSAISDEYPYLVGLAAIVNYGKINQTACSGTLVSPRFVLTSAHCTSLLQPGKFKVFSKKSTIRKNTIKSRLAVKVYTHPSYNATLRLFDLSLVKLKRPFKHVSRFARISSQIFTHDMSLDCVVVGIGALDGLSYKIPVRAKYGKSACEIPRSFDFIKYVIGYTWSNFMCTRTIDRLSPRLPCGQSDLLVCGRDKLYGVFSYGYATDNSPNLVSSTGTDTGLTDCSDPTVQSRSLLVNLHYTWIRNIVRGYPENNVLVSSTTRVTPTTNRVKLARDFPGSGDYPYLVHLQGLADEPSCGGTLLSPNHVLTSAYCTTRMTEIHVTATYNEKLHTNSTLVYVHPDFDLKTLIADVSVVILREPFNVNKYVDLADFTDPSDVNNIVVMSCAIMAKTPLAPYYYPEPVEAKYGSKACRRAIVPEIQTTVDRTWRQFICGLSNDRLEYDIGNPLICDGLQYGMFSHAYQVTNTNGNITRQTRLLAVKNYKRWITSVVAQSLFQKAAGTGVKIRRSGLVTTIIILLHLSMFRL